MSKFKTLYFDLLPSITIITSGIGAFTGFTSILDMNKYNNNKYNNNTIIIRPMVNFLGCTTIGTFIGITYPISLPICSLFVIFKKDDNI